MGTLTYFIIAAVLFIVAIVVEMILAKKDVVKNENVFDTSDIAIAIIVTFFVSATWILTVPVGILVLAVYGISRWVEHWLNE